jgi:hypothetical protein
VIFFYPEVLYTIICRSTISEYKCSFGHAIFSVFMGLLAPLLIVPNMLFV